MIIGVLIALVGGFIVGVDADSPGGYLVLGLGSLVAQIGVVAKGVEVGMRTFHSRTPDDMEPR